MRVNFVLARLPLAIFRPRQNVFFRVVTRFLATRIVNRSRDHDDLVKRLAVATLMLQEAGYRVTAGEVCNLAYRKLDMLKRGLVTNPVWY